MLSEVFTCIDNTTLNGSDSQLSVETFCRATREMYLTDGKQSHVASVCVYPRFVGVAKKELENSGINVASVAGGFPAGQTPQHIKTEEVKYVVEEGADEVDFVINRGDFLTGNTKAVFDEVAAAKEVCGNSALLKVIIETGELQTPENVYNASRLVLDAGADFVKTSTGKIPVGATPEAAYVMLLAMRDYIKISKKTVGFKAAGGISNPSDALIYYL
ncbi:MAG: deoxyribose-phosphate aldolase, partial [Bacteroidales bacterium]|nr:deoxyribose-phosphate aldolase [Bacteroidales bacterium]